MRYSAGFESKFAAFLWTPHAAEPALAVRDQGIEWRAIRSFSLARRETLNDAD